MYLFVSALQDPTTAWATFSQTKAAVSTYSFSYLFSNQLLQ